MKVCFIGSGSIGKRHIKNLSRICGERQIELEIDLFRHSKNKISTEIADLIQREIYCIQELASHYDIIFITNPTDRHYNSLEQFRHLSTAFFIEKPLFENKDKDFKNLKLDKDNLYYVACPLRHLSILKEAKRVIEKEKVYAARAICSSYLPEWRPKADYRKVYSANEKLSGGIAFELIHEWDYLVDMFGFPEQIQSIKGQYSDLEIQSDDIAVYIARYQSRIVELHIDYFGRIAKRELELYTNEGTWKFDIIKNTVEYNGKIVKVFEEEPNHKYECEMKYFLDLVSNGGDNINTISHAWEVIQMI